MPPIRPQQGKAWLHRAGDANPLEKIALRIDRRTERGEASGERHRNTFPLPWGCSGTIRPTVVTENFIYLRGPSVQSVSNSPLERSFGLSAPAILIRLLHHREGANGWWEPVRRAESIFSYLQWVHPEYTCCNRDIPRDGASKLSK